MPGGSAAEEAAPEPVAAAAAPSAEPVAAAPAPVEPPSREEVVRAVEEAWRRWRQSPGLPSDVLVPVRARFESALTTVMTAHAAALQGTVFDLEQTKKRMKTLCDDVESVTRGLPDAAARLDLGVGAGHAAEGKARGQHDWRTRQRRSQGAGRRRSRAPRADDVARPRAGAGHGRQPARSALPPRRPPLLRAAPAVRASPAKATASIAAVTAATAAAPRRPRAATAAAWRPRPATGSAAAHVGRGRCRHNADEKWRVRDLPDAPFVFQRCASSGCVLPDRCSPAGRLRRSGASGRPPRSRGGLRGRPLRRRCGTCVISASASNST